MFQYVGLWAWTSAVPSIGDRTNCDSEGMIVGLDLEESVPFRTKTAGAVLGETSIPVTSTIYGESSDRYGDFV